MDFTEKERARGPLCVFCQLKKLEKMAVKETFFSSSVLILHLFLLKNKLEPP